MPVLDASVAAKRYLPNEPGAALAAAYVDDPARVIVAPDFLLAELASAMQSAVRDGRISWAEARFAVADLQRRVGRFAPIAPFVGLAVDMARDLPHPVSDCIYLAQAVAEKDLVVTADLKFLAKTEASPWREFAVSLWDAAAP